MNREEVLDKWRRLTSPQTVSDYGITVPLEDLMREAPEVFAAEVSPYLPANLGTETEK